MEGERNSKCLGRREYSGGTETKSLRARAQAGGGVGGEEEIEALEVGSLPRARRLPRASLLRFPQRKGNPGKPLWAPFVCSRPGSDDAVDLVFKQWVCSLWGWGRGLLAVPNPADWIEFRPL